MAKAKLVSFAIFAGLLTVGCGEDVAPGATAPAESTVPTVAEVPLVSTVPADQVGSCVESTKFAAYVGDADAQQRWASVGQSDEALRALCGELGLDDPAGLAAMHLEWVAAQQIAGTPPSIAPPQVADSPASAEPAPAPPAQVAEIPEPAEVVEPRPLAPVEVASPGCDPSYPDMCLPTGGPDLDCPDVPNRQFTVLPPDTHGFDRDNNGVGCESE